MNLNQTIEALLALKAKHGCDVDVTVWQYGGGLDDLCDVVPLYEQETQTVVLEAHGLHSSGARR